MSPRSPVDIRKDIDRGILLVHFGAFTVTVQLLPEIELDGCKRDVL